MCYHLLTHQHPQLKRIVCPQATKTQPREYRVHSAVNHLYYLKTSSPSPRSINLKTTTVDIIEEQQCDTWESRYGINSATATMHVPRLHYPKKLATSNVTNVPLLQRSPTPLISDIIYVTMGIIKRHSLSE